jgi:hypothetical protein
MSMTEEEFWTVLQAPVKTNPIFYRLYYNDDGTPICYSMEDLSHNYIELTAEQFHQSPPNVRVVNGQMVVVKPNSYIKKLTPGQDGVACDPTDVCVVVTDAQPHINWKIKTYETN